MNKTVLSHDVTTAKARIRFEHNDVTFEDDFDIKLVVPGSMRIFEEMGIEFTEEYQLKAIDKLTENITAQIEQGMITKAPVLDAPVYENPAPTPPKKTKAK